MKKSITIISVCILAISIANTAHAEKITIQEPIPFAKSAHVRDAVKDECMLPSKLASFIEENAGTYDIDIAMEEKPNTKKGKYLALKITQVHANGGGMWSGAKSVSVAGRLYENGKEISNFTASRFSGGGAFGGFKGTCAILGRCVRTLGKDIAQWLDDPEADAHLGD